MNAFDTAIRVLFQDPHMAVSAQYRAIGTSTDVPLRIIISQPDVPTEFNDVRYRVETTTIDVMIEDCATPVDGDTFTFNGQSYVMKGQPMADVLQQVWTIELVPAP